MEGEKVEIKDISKNQESLAVKLETCGHKIKDPRSQNILDASEILSVQRQILIMSD